MFSNASIVFPFRVIMFLIMFILLNVAFYIRQKIADDIYSNEISIINAANPYLIPLSNKQGNIYVKKNKNKIRDYSISADVFMVFLFASLVFGISTTRALTSLVISVFHFVAIILLEHFICESSGMSYFISAFFLGVVVPFIIEVWMVLAIFVFKVDFYF